jgi:aspartate aminotransferase/aminotransferase
VKEDNIFVTPGATYGVSITVGTLINHGDEVLVPDPGYPNFAAITRHYGGIVKHYTLREEDNFQIDFDEIKKLVTDKTKLIIINSPSNPTGAVLSSKQVKNLVDFTFEKNIWLLSDEVYESYVYSGEHISPLSFSNADNVIGIYSFSKSYNMTGLRVGYVVSRNENVCSGLLKAQELYISSAPSISQMAAVNTLKFCDEEMASLKNNFKTKLQISLNILGNDVKYVPEGAFYILINISETGLSSNKFADALLENEKVAVAPGITFGPSSDKFIRIALTAEEKVLEEGLKRIKRYLNQYREK